ncbi:MAG: flagellar basal body rod protein FlgB [Methylophilales bacterium]|nr:flagellar basal body rod protein FlgB [Methylophilales bacterium]
MNSIDKAFAFQEKALEVRSFRQQLIASNIANADTPHYNAVDIDFADAMKKALSNVKKGIEMVKTSEKHLSGKAKDTLYGIEPMFRTVVQPSIDGNTVDSNIEQAQFTENSLKYMSTLTFINGTIQGDNLALRGGNN